jgi:hypothetical protein
MKSKTKILDLKNLEQVEELTDLELLSVVGGGEKTEQRILLRVDGLDGSGVTVYEPPQGTITGPNGLMVAPGGSS